MIFYLNEIIIYKKGVGRVAPPVPKPLIKE